MATDEQREAVIKAVAKALITNNWFLIADKAIAAYEAHMPIDQFREVAEMVESDVIEVAAVAMFDSHGDEIIGDADNEKASFYGGNMAEYKRQKYRNEAKAALQAIGYAELVAENERLREKIMLME